MHHKNTEQATACPLFAEWKLTDAVREFGQTMHIPDTCPVTRIPIPESLMESATTLGTGIRYLPLTITGYRHTRQGFRFVFGMEAVAGWNTAASPSSPPTGHQTPVHLPVTKPAGYLTTLRTMHCHGLPLTGSEFLIAKTLTKIFDRHPPHKNHRCRPLLLSTDITRISLPDGTTYDLPLGRCLTTEETTSVPILRESHAAYRKARGYECTTPTHTAASETYLTADLHFGHTHAIRYYCRPFVSDDIGTMDYVLTNNWNHIVSPDDHVIFAGDFTYKADRDTTDAYRSPLNGTITWVEGNHDTCLKNTVPSHTITVDGRTFLVVHNPKHVPEGYKGWVIHGHTHNARLGTYPFISFTNRTVNISTDVTGYRPVPLTEILALISDGEKTGRTAPILIREMPPNPK